MAKEKLFMETTKIEIRIGEIQFIGEGSPNWLEKQLDKILNKAESLSKLSNNLRNKSNTESTSSIEIKSTEISTQALGTFLKAKKAMTNQVLKFLVTSIWLEAKGKNRLKTSDVTGALKEANQLKLGNASECLKKNLSKGFCERDGNEYYVTDEGKMSLGL
jgi:hypothetical protein